MVCSKCSIKYSVLKTEIMCYMVLKSVFFNNIIRVCYILNILEEQSLQICIVFLASNSYSMMQLP